jgi:hypothetical protein
MTTVREVCQDALLEIGVVDLIDAMDAAKGAHMLRMLNRMLQIWNTEELMVYTVNRTTQNLVAGQQEYTYGIGGNFNVARPVRIQALSILINVGTPSALELPLDLLTDSEWQSVAVKGVPSIYPTKAWITGNYPLNSIFLWPVPSDSTVDLVIYAWGKTEAFTSLNDDVVFPNGYEEAIITNLAVMASAGFGVQPMPSLVMRSQSSRSKVQSLNLDPLYATIDNGLVGGKGRTNAVRTFGMLVD